MKKRILGLSILAAAACFSLGVWHGAPVFDPPGGNLPVSGDISRGGRDDGKPAASAPSVRADSAAPDVRDNSSTTAAAARKKSSAGTKTVRINDTEYPVRTYKPLAMPNDPSASQWWVTQSRLDQSWDVPGGSAQTVLAVIDSGFALSHEEFTDRWYTNSGESGAAGIEAPSTLNCTDRALPLSMSCNLIDDDSDGEVDNETGTATYQNPSRLNCTALGRAIDKACNRIDDDANGYVDDYSGWDFVNYDNAPLAGELNPAGNGTTHGTKVAGIAAATGNNGKGIAGVDWRTKILPLQALDDDSYGDTLSVGRSIRYAIDQGADVISISLGSELPDDFVREAVQAALAEGIVVVAAAGNDGCECMLYPANYPEVFAVGALNNSSQAAGFSSYGRNLDILAPGTGMTSPTWQSANRTAAYAGGLNGTSFAAPFIGGMLTRLKSAQPAATPAQLIAALTENVNRLGLSASVNRDVQYGFGTVDALKAADRMFTPSTGQLPYAFTPISKGNTLNPSAPSEPVNGALIYACSAGTVGSTPVYELTKGASNFFSLSEAEKEQAVKLGYTSSFLAYACHGQPHDNNTVMHNLNIFHEFRNKYPKLP